MHKYGKIGRFSKFKNFLNFQNLSHHTKYEACDPKFSSILLYLFPFPRSKSWSSYILWSMWSKIFVHFTLSITVSEIRTLLHKKFQILVILLFIMHVFPISVSLTFYTKMAKSATFQNFGKFDFFWKFWKMLCLDHWW